LLFIRLKSHNRTVHFDAEEFTKKTEKETHDLYKLQRQLHNLVYERNTIQEEIQLAQHYSPAYESMDLIGEDAVDPEQLSQAEGDRYKILKLRLQAECNERRKLTEKIRKLKERRAQLQSGNKESDTFFQGLISHVAQLRDCVVPIQEKLTQGQLRVPEDTEMAQKLPPALYLIYYQAIVYAAAHPEHLSVAIRGNKEEADAWLVQQSHQEERMDTDKESHVFAKHPLSVLCTIQPGKESLAPVEITFCYLTTLRIVTVLEKDPKRMYIKPFLVCLYPHDAGLTSPNPATASLIPSGYVFKGNQEVGKPYKFAQQLAGLSVLTEAAPQTTLPFTIPHENLPPQQAMELFISSVRYRLEAYDSLHEQITALRKSTLLSLRGYSLPRSGTTLRSCTKIDQDMYLQEMGKIHQADVHLDSLAYEDQSHSNYMLLKIALPSGSKQEECQVLVHVSVSYPFIPPLFTLLPPPTSQLVASLPDFVKNSARDADAPMPRASHSTETGLDDIERQVNTDVIQSLAESERIHVLTVQMYRLMQLLSQHYMQS